MPLFILIYGILENEKLCISLVSKHISPIEYFQMNLPNEDPLFICAKVIELDRGR
jgi:hypothetical protein